MPRFASARYVWLLAAALLLTVPGVSEPCSTARPVSPSEVVKGADVIVRATAVDYALPPSDPSVWTNGKPDSRVRFRVGELLKGEFAASEFVLPGYLTDRDVNDRKAPYTFVRPGGRHGSCFANEYRQGADFLLMLKRRDDRGYTVNWYALGPVNEQLSSADDPWLAWVRQQVGRPSPVAGAAEVREPRTPTPTTKPHTFLDTLNLSLSGVAAAALLADGITTQHLRSRDPMHICSREADPLARPFVERGWPGQIAGGALVLSADLGLRYVLHKRGRHRAERWLPAVLITYGTAGAIHNAQDWGASCF